MIENHPRLRGWEKMLAVEVASQQSALFAWGVSDCLLMVADVDEALTGHDPMAGLRGRYRTSLGATRLLRRQGFADIGAALAGTYAEQAPSMARRGDCGLIDAGDGVMGAVIVLGDTLMGKSPGARAGSTGATIVSRDRLLRAFRIGW